MAENRNQEPEAGSSQDLSLTAIIKALDNGEAMPDAEDTPKQDAFDPNATINYAQAGAGYPELPFADEKNAGIPSPNAPAAQSPNAPAARKEAASPYLGSAATRTSASSAQSSATRTSKRPLDPRDYESAGSNYRPVNTKSSSYKIRGGGGRSFKSPVFFVICAVLIIAGVGLMGYGVSNVLSVFDGSSNEVEMELTPAQTREAIDARIPVLVNYIDYGIEDTVAVIGETQFLYTNDRHTPDSPDATATDLEVVSMPLEMTSEQMDGYYSGSYNAYTLSELVEFFNGSYVMDIARGEMGNWNKLKYINLNATSIQDEMSHLAELQGLTGDGVTISAEGVDSRGNFVIQGQKVLEGDRIMYFKIAACPLNDVYTAESIGDSGVYATCTLATYDFYTGADEITPAE